MNVVTRYFHELFTSSVRGWDRFWFTPADPATLGLIRILAGSMLLYTHFVWGLDLEGFFGADGRLSLEFVQRFHDSPFAWSYLYLIDGPGLLWATHGISLVVFALLTLGLFTRVTSICAFLITVSYAHRASGALFGLDQINGLLALYLAVGPSGAAFSLDEWRRQRQRGVAVIRQSVSANIAIRLMQLHMCVIYLFAGLGKLLGESWWDGTALWGAFANYEYQTLDMTWMAHSIVLVNVLTHVTIAWEVSYCALVWPRLTRPIVVALAVPLHLGIAVCMGMITFGLIMIVGNLAFVSPQLVRQFVGHFLRSPLSPRTQPELASSPRNRGKHRSRRLNPSGGC